MGKTRLRPFVVALALPEAEREAFEAARQRLGLRAWSDVALLGWRKLKEELKLANGGENDERA